VEGKSDAQKGEFNSLSIDGLERKPVRVGRGRDAPSSRALCTQKKKRKNYEKEDKGDGE